jgi:NTP pyrophosphatase (non-canonical NTP hydrolase)
MKSFDEYQSFVASMKAYPEHYAIIYPALGLCGEAGEIAEKVKKWIRDEGGPNFGITRYEGDGRGFRADLREERREALLKELGDPLWYIAALAADLGYTLQDVVNANETKLTSRKERGVIKGSGDNR